MARPTGFEPVAFGSGGRRSIRPPNIKHKRRYDTRTGMGAESSDQFREVAEVVRQFQRSPGLREVTEVARQLQQSPALREVAEVARQLQQSPALREVAEVARQLQQSPALREVTEVARQLQQSPALREVAEVARQLQQSPALREVAEVARQLQQSPMMEEYRALAKQLQQSPALRQVAEVAKRLQQSSTLYGKAWDERLAKAVGRLERAEDIIGNASEPEQAVEELVKEAVTVQEVAARSRARKVVNTLVHHVVMAFLVELFAGPELETAGETVRAAVFSLIVTLLVATEPPAAPPLPPRLVLSTSLEIEPVTTAVILPRDWAVEGLPAFVERAGPAASERIVEFFTVQVSNPNTRAAYAKAVTQFFNWCEERGLELDEITPVTVASYIEELQGVYRAPTIKQHLAAIRRLFDWLVVGQVVPWNPAATVQGPRHIVKRGKTPVLQPEEVRLLVDAIDISAVGGLRDRALLGVMIYSFARVSSVVNMDVDDYYPQGKRWWLRRREKGGKNHALPVHHKAEAYLDAYLETTGIAAERGSPLWRSLTRTRELGERRMSRVDVFRMVKRRVKAAALGDAANCHTFRASGITAYLLNGGSLERAQAIAGHESPRTTQFYSRTTDDVTVEDVERIKI